MGLEVAKESIQELVLVPYLASRTSVKEDASVCR